MNKTGSAVECIAANVDHFVLGEIVSPCLDLQINCEKARRLRNANDEYLACNTTSNCKQFEEICEDSLKFAGNSEFQQTE